MLRKDNSLEINMDTLGKVEKNNAIVSPAFVALAIGMSAFFALLLARMLRHASAKSDSEVDISTKHFAPGQESPRNSAIRLNATWMRERSQA
jgi:hypothetical protein